MEPIAVSGNYAMWMDKEGHFGVMDIARGEVWHPLEDSEVAVRVQKLGTDHRSRAVFAITFVGTKERGESFDGTVTEASKGNEGRPVAGNTGNP
jgi:hypothetical protein